MRAPGNFADVVAFKINDAGTILGNTSVTTLSGGLRGLRWEAGSTTPVELKVFDNELKVFDKFGGSIAFDMNSTGIAVGTVQSSSTNRAVYWGADGMPVDLNSLIDPASGWTLKKAIAVSDTGWILGVGKYGPPGGQAAYDRAFLIQVPEPSGTMLGFLGVLAWLGFAWTRAERSSLPPAPKLT